MKKSKHVTVLVLDEEKTKTIQINAKLFGLLKPISIIFSIFTLSLVSIVGYLSVNLYKNKNLITENIKLQSFISELKQTQSEKISEKLELLNESEESIVLIQKYLEERGINLPSKNKNSSNNQTNISTSSVKKVSYSKKDSQYFHQENFFQPEQFSYMLQVMKTLPLGKPHHGNITSNFGHRSNPFGGNRGEIHKGIDFKANNGDNIHATADGIVSFAGTQSGYGNLVIIQHLSGYSTRYAHLSSINTSRGEKVFAGDIIGKAGSTGRSTGTHLHYEVRLEDKALNPINFITLNQ